VTSPESGAAESGAAESGAAESGAAESGAAESGAAESGAAESGRGQEAAPAAYPGGSLRVAADYAWRVLAIGTVGYFALKLLERLGLVVIPFLVSLLVTALLHPLLAFLRRRGLARGPATLATVLIAIVVLGGVLTLVVIRAAEQAPQLGNEVNNLIPHIKHWLITGPLRLNPATVNNLSKHLTDEVTKNSSLIASTALSTGKTALEVLGGIALVIFSTIFLLYDGRRVWEFLIKGAPVGARPTVDMAGQAAWNTLSDYVRGTLVVAAFHGIVILITLTILGVPLAFPLAVLVALGSFIPLVGAVVTGALAVGVAALSKGVVAAVIVVAVLVINNQIEAHALQPFVVGRYVRVHPLAVVLALATGGLLFGIFGAIIAVPIVACANSAVRAARAARAEGRAKDQPGEGDPIPPGGG
jgi:predicted PurR-regulated permease PerM